MVNQELLDYTKEQLAIGIAREKIVSDLTSTGWGVDSIQEAFSVLESVHSESKYWSRWILVVNTIFLSAVIILMFIVNVYILVTDSLRLGLEIMITFYGIMLVPTAIFVSVYFYEKKILSKKYKESNSKLDPWFLVLILVRNIAFVLSVIPFIQVVGTAALVVGGVPYIIIYYFMIRARNKLAVAV